MSLNVGILSKQVEAEDLEVQSNITKEITEFNSKVWNDKKNSKSLIKRSNQNRNSGKFRTI